MNQPRDLGSPPTDTRHLSTTDEWISPRDYNFHMDVSNRLTVIEETLKNMKESASNRRWLIGMVISGMIASAAVTSTLMVILTQVFNGGS